MSIIKKLTAALLALAMVFGALVALNGVKLNVVTAEGKEDEESSIHLDKVAWLEADGTYSLRLEAYATGTEVESYEAAQIPTDFVLVIDQSGSMEDVLTYAGHTYYHYHLKAIKAACKSFIRELYKSGADHRVAIAGFAMENTAGYNYMNTGIFNGSTTDFVNYNNASGSDYANAFMSVQTATTEINTCIDKLSANGGTATHIGMELANSILDAHKTDKYDGVNLRNKVVIVFSDGTPGYYGYCPQWAAKAVNLARTAKSTYNAKVLTVALVNDRLNVDTHNYYNGNYPNGNEIQATHANTSAFMDALSSNYPNASGDESTGAISAGTRDSSAYYLNVTDSVDMNYASNSTFDNVTRLTDAFLNIPEIVITSSSSSVSGTNLNAESIMKDYISEHFSLDEEEFDRLKAIERRSTPNATEAEIERRANIAFREMHVFVRMHNCIGQNADGSFKFNPLHDHIDGVDDPTDDSAFRGDSYYEPWYSAIRPVSDLPGGLTEDNVRFDFYAKSIEVDGFDYAANYCRKQGSSYYGKKLVVVIKGLVANPDTVGDVPTNLDTSGIYPTPSTGKITDELRFPVPRVHIREHVVVYDFGIRLHDDHALDFFGSTPDNHDVKRVLSLDDCYGVQGNFYWQHYGFDEDGYVNTKSKYLESFDWDGFFGEELENYSGEYFEYKTVYPYDKLGNGRVDSGIYYPLDYGYPASKDYETKKDLFKVEIVSDDSNGDHCAFEPYTISHEDYTLAAFLQLNSPADPNDPNDPNYNHGLPYKFEWCRLTFLPATNVLYEERIVNIDGVVRDNGFMTFTDGDDASAYWKHDNGWHDGDYQSASNTVYGMDADYTNHSDNKDSHGGAHYVTVDETMYNAASTDPNYNWPSCEFTFKGTGIDLISRSGADTGVLVVHIVPAGIDPATGKEYAWKYKGTTVTDPITGMPMVDADGNTVKSKDYAHVMVDTTYVDGAEKCLYQIPVLRYDGLDYGKYKVLISAIYMPGNDHQNFGSEVKGAANFPGIPDVEYEYQSVFPECKGAPTKGKGSFTGYIDAVRVYHPRGNKISGKGVDELSYIAANNAKSELNPEYMQLKKLFLSQAENGDQVVNLYVDEFGEKPVTVKDYANDGPNNEVYIKKSGSVAFKLEGKYAGVHISAKTPFDQGAVTLKVNGTAVASIAHATELYYDVTSLIKNDMITITCDGSDDAILSLVNIKLIPEVGLSNVQSAPNIVCDQSVVDFSEAVICGIEGDANHDRQLSMQDALLAMRCALSAAELDEYGNYCADMNGDGIIDLADCVAIMRLALAN